VESLRVEPGAHGTVARVRQPLTRPARLLDQRDGDGAPAGLVPPGADEFRIVEQPGGDETRVRLEGPLDLATAEAAERELLRRGRGGTVPLAVDLSGVTHLSSVGVSALHRVAGQHDGSLELDAPPGSPARVILDLVALQTSPTHERIEELSTG